MRRPPFRPLRCAENRVGRRHDRPPRRSIEEQADSNGAPQVAEWKPPHRRRAPAGSAGHLAGMADGRAPLIARRAIWPHGPSSRLGRQDGTDRTVSERSRPDRRPRLRAPLVTRSTRNFTYSTSKAVTRNLAPRRPGTPAADRRPGCPTGRRQRGAELPGRMSTGSSARTSFATVLLSGQPDRARCSAQAASEGGGTVTSRRRERPIRAAHRDGQATADRSRFAGDRIPVVNAESSFPVR